MAQQQNYNDSGQQTLADFRLGMRVDRAESTVPHTTTTSYFRIYGGKVLMTMLVGEMTVAIDGANNITINHTPTTGTAAAIAAFLDMNPWVIGDIVTISGLLTGNILPAVHAGSVNAMAYSGVVMTPGTLDFAADATTAGDWKWSLWYVPLEDGAYVGAI